MAYTLVDVDSPCSPRRWNRWQRCARAGGALPARHAAMTPSASPPLLALGADGRATITLHRPRHLNRLHREDLLALQDHFARIADDPAVRVLRGSPAAGPRLLRRLPSRRTRRVRRFGQ